MSVTMDDLYQAANEKAAEHIENAKQSVRANLDGLHAEARDGLMSAAIILAMRSQLFLAGEIKRSVLTETIEVHFNDDFMPVIAAALLLGSLSMMQIVADYAKEQTK